MNENLSLSINISAFKAPILTNEITPFKLTIKEDFENRLVSIKERFTSLKLTKSVHFFLGYPTFISVRIFNFYRRTTEYPLLTGHNELCNLPLQFEISFFSPRSHSQFKLAYARLGYQMLRCDWSIQQIVFI